MIATMALLALIIGVPVLFLIGWPRKWFQHKKMSATMLAPIP